MGASTDPEGRPVSHPRSSNRTCRFPASGFPTGFTVNSRTGPQLHWAESDHSQLPKDHVVRETCGAARWHLVTPPQEVPYAGRSRLVLRLAVQLDLKFPDLTRCCETHRQSPL